MSFGRTPGFLGGELPDPHLRADGWSVELELSTNYSRLILAAERLARAPGPQRMLIVSHHNIDRAVQALRLVGLNAWVRTLWGDDGCYVRADWPADC